MDNKNAPSTSAMEQWISPEALAGLPRDDARYDIPTPEVLRDRTVGLSGDASGGADLGDSSSSSAHHSHDAADASYVPRLDLGGPPRLPPIDSPPERDGGGGGMPWKMIAFAAAAVITVTAGAIVYYKSRRARKETQEEEARRNIEAALKGNAKDAPAAAMAH